MSMRALRILSAVSITTFSAFGYSQKKPLDHSVYDGWKSIRGTTLSRDGKWLAYVTAPQEGDATGTIRSVTEGRTISLPNANVIRFTSDGKFALATLAPEFEASRKARRDNVPAISQPKSALAIVDLVSGKTERVERVASFSLPERDSGWFAYRLEPPKPATPEKKEDKEASSDSQTRRGRTGAETPAATTTRGAVYVLRQLATGKEHRLEAVEDTAWDKKGLTFAFTVATGKKPKELGDVGVYDLTHDKLVSAKNTVPKAKFSKIVLSEDGLKVAFTTDRDDMRAKKPLSALYLAPVETLIAKRVPIPNADDSVNAGGAFRFTPSGKRLIFSTSKKPLADPPETPADEKVSVDIWTYKDDQIMPQQLIQAARERSRGYDAIYDVSKGASVQIETPDLPAVQFGDEGDGLYGIADVSKPYGIEATYNPGFSDLYAIDLRTGVPRKLLTHYNGSASLSPDGGTVAVYLGEKKEWVAYDLKGGEPIPLSAKIPYPVYDELDDHPADAPSYGLGGWTKSGKVIVRDKYDLWLCDPKGLSAPQNLTGGRVSDLVFTPVDLDPESRTVDIDDLPLTVINDRTKDGGVFWRRNGSVQKIMLGDRKYAFVDKADAADTLVFSRQDVTEYPDLWLTNVRFDDPKKVTDANPQQKEYNWLKGEIVTWTSADGTPLQGILYKPENFDYGKKYPLISYFYERNSDTLHDYKAPAPSASTINIPLFVSQGYLVFVPDIPYKPGAPGQSALSAIVPGVNSIVSRGYVDPKRLGIQGQSWGGYQVAYLVTATNMFAAAEAGAPVSDMFSAYGGIRYGSGSLRQMQYEHGQSRIGGTPWDSFLKYVDNSPVFHIDRVNTPLMIMSNDKDGAVPHTQGIELYSAMRRLGKPCWMVVYNDEDHNLVQRKNRKDLSIRLSQFFDHFLKGAPMPVWMKEGVPAVEKGRTMGTELTKP